MTNKIRIRLVFVVIILQLSFFAGWYAIESGVLKTPVTTIMVKTQSYGPRDLLSGQYIRLTYSFSTIIGLWDSAKKKTIYPEWAEGLNVHYKYKKEIWVILHEIDGFYEPKAASYNKPSNLREGEVAIRGIIRNISIKYGIERYFVPEGTPEPERDDTTVRINIYENGATRIDQVFVDGKEWH